MQRHNHAPSLLMPGGILIRFDPRCAGARSLGRDVRRVRRRARPLIAVSLSSRTVRRSPAAMLASGSPACWARAWSAACAGSGSRIVSRFIGSPRSRARCVDWSRSRLGSWGARVRVRRARPVGYSAPLRLTRPSSPPTGCQGRNATSRSMPTPRTRSFTSAGFASTPLNQPPMTPDRTQASPAPAGASTHPSPGGRRGLYDTSPDCEKDRYETSPFRALCARWPRHRSWPGRLQ